MDAREFQELASDLVGGTTAAQFRTAISRAYYATYHVGVEILEDLGFPISKGPGGHGEVRHHFSNSGEPEVARVASQLNDLQGRRIDADYRLDRTEVENQDTARTLVEQARRMIRTLDQCRLEPKRSEMVTAISNWKGKISGGGP